jgi:stage III sporulation protein AE
MRIRSVRGLLLVAVLLVVLLLPITAGAAEESPLADAGIEGQLEVLDLSGIEEFLAEIDKDVGAYLPDFTLEGVIRDFRNGDLDLNFSGFLNGMLKYLFHELVAHAALLGRLVVLAVICAVLYNLLDAFEGSTGQLAYTIVYLLLMTVALVSFTGAVKVGSEAISDMVSFVQALVPVLLTLLAAVGGISSVAILHPFIIASLALLGTLIKNFVFPLIYFAAVLGIVNHISDRVKVSRLAGLLKQVGVASLGVFLTMFVGFLGLQGLAGAVADSVTLKTAKFMTGAFVPVVGKMLADATEVVLGASLLIKNAVGIVGIVILFVLCVFPVIKILAMVLVYRLAAALVQPIGDTKVAEALDTMAGMLTLVFASVAAVGLMFFLAVAVIVGLGNVNVMLR